MTVQCRFAILSDPHIALPHTIWNHPTRFHLVEVGIPLLEEVLAELEHQSLDFLLIPGDLTQHGELENHDWLSDRLSRLPYPVYVVPGNHDVLSLHTTVETLGLQDFATVYKKLGYAQTDQPYYIQRVATGVRLVGLNSIAFGPDGNQHGSGHLDAAQLEWLRSVLSESDELTIVMVHHNVVEHLPGQSKNSLGSRYMLSNAPELKAILQAAGVPLILTGHLHVQDIAYSNGLWEITTGSLVSYPHPYRVLTLRQSEQGRSLQISSRHMPAAPGWPNLQHQSREWMGDRALPLMLKLLTAPPLQLEPTIAEALAPDLRYFWADIAHGDRQFEFAHFPPKARRFFQRCGAVDGIGNARPIDNDAILEL